jgi:hypothetical protein
MRRSYNFEPVFVYIDDETAETSAESDPEEHLEFYLDVRSQPSLTAQSSRYIMKGKVIVAAVADEILNERSPYTCGSETGREHLDLLEFHGFSKMVLTC